MRCERALRCREGIYAAIAEATANGVTYTVLFFPDGRRYNRQLRSYDRRWLVDFMPNKAMHTPGGPFTCGARPRPRRAALPCRSPKLRCVCLCLTASGLALAAA